MITKKIFILISLILFILIFSIQNSFALILNSSNYSVGMFGIGIATADPSSTNYEAESLLISQSGTRNAGSENYTVNIGFFENTTYYGVVSIVSYSISPTSAVVGSTIGLSISALNYQSVWAKITSPNSQEQTLNLINGAIVNYLPNPSVVGIYEVVFYANSFTGSIASVVDSFELTAQTTTPSSGGGGGGTTRMKKCTYIWDCSSWNICSDGKQTRGCKNIGTCEGIEGKPLEERICSDALFDVTIKFEDLIITENNTLKFNVNLIEQEGIEKIDVQIKYFIIDKEGYEIFNQIETKAIQRNLSYQKEIEEIKLMDGEYILRVEILYGNLQRAFTEQNFEVKKGELEISFKKKISLSKSQIIYSSLIFIIILMIFILIKLIRKRKKILKKIKIWYKRRIKKILKGYKIKVSLEKDKKVIKPKSSKNILKKLVEKDKIKVSFGKLKEQIKPQHPKNSVNGLMDKKVYTEGGKYIGKVNEVVIGNNRIDSLKIKLDNLVKKKNRIEKKGIIIKYHHVKNVGHIVIIQDKVLEHLKSIFNIDKLV